MAPGPSKFEGPKAHENLEPGRFSKLATRVEEILDTMCLSAEAKQLDPDLVLTGINNRLGAAPNVRHIHLGILKSFKEKGFDRTRTPKGICIEYKSEAGIKKLLEHNKKFSKGNRNLPPILEIEWPQATNTVGGAGHGGATLQARRGPAGSQSLVAFPYVPYTPIGVRLRSDQQWWSLAFCSGQTLWALVWDNCMFPLQPLPALHQAWDPIADRGPAVPDGSDQPQGSGHEWPSVVDPAGGR